MSYCGKNDQAAAHSLGLGGRAWVSSPFIHSTGEVGNLGKERARQDVVGGYGIVVKTGLQNAVMLQTESGVVGKGQMIYHILLPLSP